MLKKTTKVVPHDRHQEYPTEQQYDNFEDYEEFYGPDAYLGDWYPMTSIRNQTKEFALPFTKTEAELTDRNQQETRKQTESLPWLLNPFCKLLAINSKTSKAYRIYCQKRTAAM